MLLNSCRFSSHFYVTVVEYLWATAVTIIIISVLTVRKATGPPASRRCFLSEFWLWMSHLAASFQEKKASPLSKPCSGALRSTTLTPPTAPVPPAAIVPEQPHRLHQKTQ